MPRPPSVDPLRATIQALGEQIGTELANAITRSFNENISIPAKGRGPGRPPKNAVNTTSVTGGKGCAVPGCSRAHAAKGLCQNHYAKAIRLKLATDKLSSSNLDTLAQDGRALRFKKA